jgi:aspartyl aminopeptidase
MKTLLRFLQNGKTQFHVAALAKEYLDSHGFTPVSDREELAELAAGKYYLAPFSSIVIPFVKGTQSTQVRIACAHTDFPMLKVKPNPELKKQGYLQINVEPYGGLIKETWFDRPLGLAGKVICKSDSIFHPEIKLFDSEKPVAIIPNLAPHLKRGSKEGELDVQKELIPIVDMAVSMDGSSNQSDGQTQQKNPDSHFLLSYVAEKLNVHPEDVLDFDLYLYIYDAPTTVGINDALVTSPRIDNISSVCAILEGLADTEPSDTLCIGALFDNEEIGSRSKQGADSMLLSDIVNRLTAGSHLSLIEDGFYLSVDVAHATHPNYSEKADITNTVLLGKGAVLKSSASQRYVCDSEAGACIIDLCNANHIALQRTVNRSGMPGGQTLGPIVSSYLPMRACDIGIPVLAMHSASELMHKDDYAALAALITAFYRQ